MIDVDAGPDPDDAWRLVIRLDYRVRASLTPGQLVFSVDLLPVDEPAPEDSHDAARAAPGRSRFLDLVTEARERIRQSCPGGPTCRRTTRAWRWWRRSRT
ncbi:hypothetical protein NKG94_10855 [Micromonospora sp. M12]